MAAPDLPDERAERLLDAAADLLVRWGYQRVTVEEVARQAGIGKGTVYLHFRTKDALLLTVLLRVHRRLLTDVVARMQADPAEILPGRLVRSTFLAVAADPVTRPLYLGDAEVLGRLAREAAGTLGELGAQRAAGSREYLGLLRGAGLVRTDLSPDAQLHLLGAVTTGFFVVDPLDLPHAPADMADRAALLEHAVAAALHAPEPAPGAAAELAPAVAALYRPLIDHIDAQWRRRTR
jgi:AcrR family transcriptional regulator